MSEEKDEPLIEPAPGADADAIPPGEPKALPEPSADPIVGEEDSRSAAEFLNHFRLVVLPVALTILARARLVAWPVLFAIGFGLFSLMAYRVYFVSDSRVKTFYDLEMYEGDMAIQAIRVLDGKELFPKRDSDYIPLLYNPLSTYIQALAMKIIDPPGQPHSLYAGRMVSVCATWIALLVLFGWVYRETRHPLAALAAPLYFVAINPFVGWWFDLFRVDMTFIAFVALGSWPFLDRRDKSDRAEIIKGCLAGFFYACAFFTKQTAGPLGIVLTMLALIISPLRAVWAMAIGLTVSIIGLMYLNWSNHDFWYLTVTVPSKHIQVGGDWLPIITKDYLLPAAPALAVFAAWIILVAARRQWRMLTAVPMLGIALLASLRGLITMGGYINHYITLWFFTTLYFGIGLGSLMPHVGAVRHDRKRLAAFGAAVLVLFGALAVGLLHPRFHEFLGTKFLYKQPSPTAIPAFRLGVAFFEMWQIPFYCALAAVLLWLGLSARWQASARPRPRIFAVTPLAVVSIAGLAVAIHSGVIKWDEIKPSAQPVEAPKAGAKVAANPGFNLGYVLSPREKGFTQSFFRQLKWTKQLEALRWKIPNKDDAARGAKIIEAIRRLDGNVWIPHANYYNYLAGRPTDISSDHVRDVYLGGQGVTPYVINMLDSQKYKYILLNNINIDHDWQALEVTQAIKRNYVFKENWDQAFGPGAMRPVDRTGQKPRALLVRKRDAGILGGGPAATPTPPAPPMIPGISKPMQQANPALIVPRPIITPRGPVPAQPGNP